MILSNAQSVEEQAAYGFRAEHARPAHLLASCPAYRPTPLVEITELPHRVGIDRLWVKDETSRMGLGSFKALGGAFAVAQIILDRSGAADPMSEQARHVARATTFITASAGNHGLSVAAGARVFSAQARIVLSSGVPEAFARRIRQTGADVIRVDGSYEDSVATAMRLAEANGWVHLADGSWDGYTAAPALVMEGYTVLAEECRQSFEAAGEWPDTVVLQAGVGGLAAAVAAHIRTRWDRQPDIVVVEPAAAPCLMESVRAGRLTAATGPVSNMARLDCKAASLLAFDALRRDADAFVTVTDEQAAEAVEDLAAAGIATTPSGAAGLAALRHIECDPRCRAMIIASEGPEG